MNVAVFAVAGMLLFFIDAVAGMLLFLLEAWNDGDEDAVFCCFIDAVLMLFDEDAVFALVFIKLNRNHLFLYFVVFANELWNHWI